MTINFKDYQDKLLFVPLGGTNEIGMNVNLYHYAGKWLMVDCGSGFAEEHLPGVDMVVADLSFIEKRKKDLLGIVLTHAHEDHLGGIQYLWNELGCPIYATKFTKIFLEAKLVEYNLNCHIQTINTDARLELGPFSMEMIGLTHSAPEMQALMIRTKAGNILHTGDWKFDPEPIIGQPSDFSSLQKCGDEGVLALICDSTNVFDQGHSGSEGEVRKSLVKIIAECPEMAVVTTFASNLARLDTLIHAGQEAGRKIILSGRSLHRMFEAAQASGYLTEVKSIIDEQSINNYKRSEILVIATGCQGETRAAMSKMANGIHQAINLQPKDTVIFSSKIIPGNEKTIFKLFNLLVKQDIDVITEKDHFVHVSGHPSVEELKKMYELVRPEICIPVHGEPVHIHEHAKLAKKYGINKTLKVENGSVVLLEEKQAKLIGRVENGYLAVDGNYLVDEDSPIFRMRRRMREAGIAILTLILDEKYQLVCPPILSVPGIFDLIEDRDLIEDFKRQIHKTLEEQYKRTKNRLTLENIEFVAKRTLKRAIKQEINKNPIIIVNLEEA